MYLDRIEINGFKSFADKTVIHFDRGVTAIVGPNGSGKSNLSEAIKWVLGEQSAKSLRGKKMDDIIFAGSQSRKPVNVAEVTLVLNNEDGFLPMDTPEIYITRRMHRNGDSENFINKKPVRLKDIVNLLMDSGLGKDSFSIISQGKVEQIFHNKPEERRAMFEEVAGVLKYKTRKQEAVRKLAKTQEHLDRVEDILFEIEGQLKPLKIQRENALIYQEKKTQLSSVDITFLVIEIDSLASQLQLVQDDIKQLEAVRLADEAQVKSLQNELATNKDGSQNLESVLTKLREKFVETVEKFEQTHGAIKVIQEKQAFAKIDKGQQLERQEQLNDQINRATQMLEELQATYKDNNQRLKAIDKVLNQLRTQETALKDVDGNEIETIRQEYIQLLQQEAKLKNDLVYFEREKENLNRQLEQSTIDSSENAESLKQTISSLEKDHQQATEMIDRLTETFQTVQQAVQQLSQEKDKLQKNYQEVLQDLHQKEARKNSLAELEDDYAGFYQGVRFVLKNKNELSGIHGALAELVTVPMDLTHAINIALGAAMQNVVVENTDAAKQAITYLKKNKAGRATFLPLDVIKGRQKPDLPLKGGEKGFIGVASDLVSYDKMYQPIVKYYLAQTLVVTDLDAGNAIAQSLEHRYKVVTLEGDVIHTGGSMSGGSQRNESTLLSRKTQLDQLKKDVRHLKDVRNDLTVAIQQVDTRIHEQTQELEDVRQKGVNARVFERDVLAKLDNAKQQFNQQALVAKRQQALADEATQQLKVLAMDSQQATTSLENVTQQIAVKKEAIALYSGSHDERMSQLETLQQKIADKSTQIAVLKQEQQTVLNQKKDWEKRQVEAKTLLESVALQQAVSGQSYEELQEELRILEETHAQLAIDRSEMESLIAQKQVEKTALDVQIADKEALLNTLIEKVQEGIKQQGSLESRQARLDVGIDTHLDRLREDYALTYEAAVLQANSELTLQEASQLVGQLKKDIEQLGVVNLAAIEEYEQVQERFEFMSDQQNDLISAKEGLLHTMSEMDTEMTKRFKSTFFAIKERFEYTFPKLFGGGRASLSLTDPDNLLETGIDIIAQPPGKRLQNLSLLSGGEKAFTAIALLFAILEVKPVPFCLLDEVEAALDEANVSRYGRYLKEFVDQTQFIVITHRKGTMEESDVLYGVTMQESGVSKLATVRFEDYIENE